MRERAQLLITNPDMLHCSILPVHGQFARLLANLRYVVVDEGHAYRCGPPCMPGQRSSWGRLDSLCCPPDARRTNVRTCMHGTGCVEHALGCPALCMVQGLHVTDLPVLEVHRLCFAP